MAQLEMLKSEIDNDPLTRGYAGMTDQQIAESLNAVDRTVTAEFLSGSDVLNNTDHAEFTALTVGNQQKWLQLCAVDSIDTSSGIAKSLEASLFGPGTATRTALLAARQSTVSRATELGIGFVQVGIVQQVRAS